MDCSTGNTNELGFCVRKSLPVEAPQRPASKIEGSIALDELWVESMNFEFIYAKGSGEIAAVIPVLFEFKHECPMEWSFSEKHNLPQKFNNILHNQAGDSGGNILDEMGEAPDLLYRSSPHINVPPLKFSCPFHDPL